MFRGSSYFKHFCFLLSNIFLGVLLLFTKTIPVSAQAEFENSTSIIYEVNETGETLVTQETTLTNLTPNLYASEYKLTVGSTNVKTTAATSTNTDVTLSTQTSGDSTEIKLEFKKGVVGLNQKLDFTLSYTSSDFAKKRGRILKVDIPKLANSESFTDYNLKLIVPKIFGSSNFIFPDPFALEENENKHIFIYNKTSLSDKAISASFGDYQVFDFSLKYHLKNESNFEGKTSIAFPPDTPYQQVFYENLKPSPFDVSQDSDGNFIAYYTLKPQEEIEVILAGKAKVISRKTDFRNFTSKISDISQNLLENYTKADNFWESSDEEIKKKALELTNPEELAWKNAKQIFDFVVSFLTYNAEGFEKRERKGGVKTLKNPEKSVCIEFTDLLITLLRAASIPARELDGYAYSEKSELKTVLTDVLHSWVEIYLPETGWIGVDPTWENTSEGEDFFTKIGTDHFVFVTKGTSSESPYPAGSYKTDPENQTNDVSVDFYEGEININPKVEFKLKLPEVLTAGIGEKGNLIIKNTGALSLNRMVINLEGADTMILPNSFFVKNLLPFAQENFKLEVKPTSLISPNQKGIIIAKLSAQESLEKNFTYHTYFDVSVKPLYKTYLLPIGIGMGGGGLIFLLIIILNKRFKFL